MEVKLSYGLENDNCAFHPYSTILVILAEIWGLIVVIVIKLAIRVTYLLFFMMNFLPVPLNHDFCALLNSLSSS